MQGWPFNFAAALVLVLPGTAWASNPVVVIDTSLGEIKLELFADKALLTVKNFLQYVDDGFYAGTIFHRVISNFMIQGGGHLPGLKEKPARPPIKYEEVAGLRNVRGTIALARTTNPNSGTCQFFINVKDNVVFGKVIGGMEVVDKIKSVPTGNRNQLADVPIEDVVIKSIRRAAYFHLLVGNGAVLAVGRAMTITAHVEYPAQGQFLTLELPAGLEFIEGKEIQPVAAIPEVSASFVTWRVL
jgi:cyclophilin family peptidyl-prolyl cis-trans isomerase